jgi:hypothetical protein
VAQEQDKSQDLGTGGLSWCFFPLQPHGETLNLSGHIWVLYGSFGPALYNDFAQPAMLNSDLVQMWGRDKRSGKRDKEMELHMCGIHITDFHLLSHCKPTLCGMQEHFTEELQVTHR